MKKRIRNIVLFVSLVLTVFISCSRETRLVYQKSKALIDTYVTITVVADSADAAERVMTDAFAAIEVFGRRIDFYSNASELAAINRNAGIKGVVVSPETLDVIQHALRVAEKSDGAFDPTIGPVISLWDFHRKVMPSDADLKKNVPLVNYRNVLVNEESREVFLKEKNMLLDLGGIAKGYAADIAVRVLKDKGISGGIVAVAGDIVTFGTKPDGKSWNVGIKNPRQKGKSDEIIAAVRLSGKAISSAGDYERYFMAEGRRYHHLLDPKTGYPAGHCRSASVIAGSGVLADAFSTAAFILGPVEGMKLLQESGMEGIFVSNSGEIVSSPGIQGSLKIERSP